MQEQNPLSFRKPCRQKPKSARPAPPESHLPFSVQVSEWKCECGLRFREGSMPLDSWPLPVPFQPLTTIQPRPPQHPVIPSLARSGPGPVLGWGPAAAVRPAGKVPSLGLVGAREPLPVAHPGQLPRHVPGTWFHTCPRCMAPLDRPCPSGRDSQGRRQQLPTPLSTQHKGRRLANFSPSPLGQPRGEPSTVALGADRGFPGISSSLAAARAQDRRGEAWPPLRPQQSRL